MSVIYLSVLWRPSCCCFVVRPTRLLQYFVFTVNPPGVLYICLRGQVPYVDDRISSESIGSVLSRARRFLHIAAAFRSKRVVQ